MRPSVATRQETPPALVGRESEVSELCAFVATAGQAGGALIVTGDAGLGKSALLEIAIAHARATGVRTVALTGPEFSASQPFSALAHVIGPLLSDPGLLTRDQERVLAVAFGTRTDPLQSPLLVCTAALSAVRRASLAAPLLITVDDAHWLDEASAEVLAFVARRLQGSAAGLLAASRPATGPLSAHGRIPVRHLTRLTDDAARDLLASRFPTLSVQVRERLVAEAEGIPLALVELPLARAGTGSGQAQRRARHLRPVTEAPREQFATALEDAAARALRRSDAPAAQAAARPPSLEAQTVHGYLAFNEGDLVSAYRAFTGALRRYGSTADNPSLTHALEILHMVCQVAGSDEMWSGFRRTLAEQGHRQPASLRLTAEIGVHGATPPGRLLAELDSAVDDLAGEDDPRIIVQIAAAAAAVDHGIRCQFPLRRVLGWAGNGGTASSVVPASHLLAEIALVTGNTAEARDLATSGLAWCRSAGHVPYAMSLRSVLAMSAAASGDRAALDALTEPILRWATPARAYPVLRAAYWARAREALSRSDYAAARCQLAAMAGNDGLRSLADRQPAVLFDLVDAAAGSGHRDVARACATRAYQRIHARAPNRWQMIALGALALVDERDPTGMFDRAVTLRSADRWPFDLARVRLAYGEHLRRLGAHESARVQLNSALDTFRILQASPWITRAADQLRCAGEAVVGIKPASSPLTGQEERVAALAAAGLTNQDIALRIHLSARTVGGHLQRVFHKMGVTSRAQLRDALTARPRSR